ncbi:MAG: hypothetical protein NC122_08545 [Faecalibacterium sp.]|nr:hypothetical protein [Ruminococcus sp.]MCM1392555.1 hypothetical protein [Ruminococcus sp.]MCM1486242.1 hypothetical protein [Faecalibacterium sp.]
MTNNENFEFENAVIDINGKPIFDFEKANPPILNERILRQEQERRTLTKQIRVLRIASALMTICLALFAFLVAPKSIAIAIITIVILCISMIGCGVITILFYKNGYSSFEL